MRPANAHAPVSEKPTPRRGPGRGWERGACRKEYTLDLLREIYMSPRHCARACACGRVVNGPCTHCRRSNEHRRGSAASRGFGKRQAQWRQLVLANDPVCRGCRRSPSVYADHIVAVPPENRDAGDWSLENGQGLCPSCDGYKRRIEQYTPSFGQRLRAAGTPPGWRDMEAFRCS